MGEEQGWGWLRLAEGGEWRGGVKKVRVGRRSLEGTGLACWISYDVRGSSSGGCRSGASGSGM